MASGVNNINSLVPQGGALTATQVQRVLIQPLVQASVFLSSGVRILDSANPVQLPIAPPPNEALAWVAEGAQIPEVTPQFNAKTLLPSTMQSIKIITRFTRQLARQSVVAIDQALQTNLVQSVAASLDNAFVSGNGDGVTTVQGLLNYPNTQTVAVAGVPTVDAFYDALSKALGAFVPEDELQWWMRHETYIQLHKQKASGTGDYLLQPDPAKAGRSTLLGIPVVVTDRLPLVTGTTNTTTAVLWSPSRTTVVRDLNADVTILPERYAEFDEIGIRTTARLDAGTAQPASIVKLTGLTVA